MANVSAYAADVFNARVVKEVALLMKPEDAQEVLAWTNSEVGKRVTMAEQRSSDTLGVEKKAREGARVLSRASPQRRALLEKVFKNSSTARVELHYNTCHMAGLARGKAEIEQPGNQQVIALIEQTRAYQLSMIDDQLKERESDDRKRNALAYDGVEEKDLLALHAHMQTAGHKTLVQGLSNGWCSAMEKAGYVFGRMSSIRRPSS